VQPIGKTINELHLGLRRKKKGPETQMKQKKITRVSFKCRPSVGTTGKGGKKEETYRSGTREEESVLLTEGVGRAQKRTA